jgi:hypothetical protein
MRKQMVDMEIFHCKCIFGVVRMPTKILQNLDMYPVMDKRQMKTIDGNYSVRMGYWASRITCRNTKSMQQ